ncbi:MAG: DUF4242 domain-containing protein [Gammaproteobacteria bacterium]|nr:DUF4242 domain-containing protein [Gammaproteobacteria bacterium]
MRLDVIGDDNFDHVLSYFSRALRDERRIPALLIKPSMAGEAREALKTCRQVEDLVSWIESYVSESGWGRCLTAVRQRRYSEGRPETTLYRIDKKLLAKLRCEAKRRKLTLEQLLETLLK